MKLPVKNFLFLLLRLLPGFILAYAGYVKLIEPAANFEASILRFGLVPESLIPVISHTYPWIEWVTGVCLMLGYLPRLSSGAAAFLSASFLIVILASGELWSGSASSCGCFGEGGPQLTIPQIFAVDLFSLASVGFLLLRNQYPFSLDRWLKKSS